jgi:hypothetical protein
VPRIDDLTNQRRLIDMSSTEEAREILETESQALKHHAEELGKIAKRMHPIPRGGQRPDLRDAARFIFEIYYDDGVPIGICIGPDEEGGGGYCVAF